MYDIHWLWEIPNCEADITVHLRIKRRETSGAGESKAFWKGTRPHDLSHRVLQGKMSKVKTYHN